MFQPTTGFKIDRAANGIGINAEDPIAGDVRREQLIDVGIGRQSNIVADVGDSGGLLYERRGLRLRAGEEVASLKRLIADADQLVDRLVELRHRRVAFLLTRR